MIVTALLEAALTKIGEKAIEITGDRLRLGDGGAISVRDSGFGKPLDEHLRVVANWASEISFRDLTGSKELRDSFVDLDLNIGIHRSSISDIAPLRVSGLLDVKGNFVILGDPGAGKTTSLKRIALTAIERTAKGTSSATPLLIRLRDIPGEGSLAGSLLTLLGLVVEGLGPTDDPLSHQYRLQAAAYYLEKLDALILLDGIDEIDPGVRERLIQDLRYLLLALDKGRIVATCRAGDFRYSLDRCKAVTLRPLTVGQVRQFAIKWLGSEKANRFIEMVSKNPYSGSEVRPLTLAHLCAIYERSGTVPEKPKTVYRKIVRLLLEEWDEQRSIRRYSQYGNFEVDRKEEFLEAMAYHLTTRFQTTTFSHEQLESAYYHIFESFSLPRSDVERVVREVESHTGLVVQVSEEQYEFAHKSIQEFLTASYLIKLPELPIQLFLQIPHELALTVALSSSPTLYFISIVRKFSTSRRPHGGFAEPFIQRLLAERVELSPTLELGIAVTALYSFASEMLGDGRELLPIALVEFLSLATVTQALGKYLKLCSISDQSDGRYVVEPSSSELAATVAGAYGRSVFKIAKPAMESTTLLPRD